MDLVQYSQEPIKHNASRLDRPGLSAREYAHPYVKPHSDSVTGSTSSSELRNAHHPSFCQDQVTAGIYILPSKSTSHLSQAVTMKMAASQQPGHKTLGPNSSSLATSQLPGHKILGPNSSSLHKICREDNSKSTHYVFSELKVGIRANQFQPKVKQSDIPVKHNILHSHDLPLGHSDNHTTPVDCILTSEPTVTTNSSVLIKDPMC